MIQMSEYLEDKMLISNYQYNIGHICTRQQCEAGFSDKIAMRWVSHDLTSREYSFYDLDIFTNKFANALRHLGLNPGDIIFTFLPKMPEQIIAFLGALKQQLITGTLFANFGEDALLDRLGDAQAKCIITKKSFLKKINNIKSKLPELRYIILVDGDHDLVNGIYSYNLIMEAASSCFVTPTTDPNTPSVLHYTSGSTGKPKGVLHRHNSILHQNRTTNEVLNLKSDDTYWCTADQGWVTGTSYGIIGPWSMGISQVHFNGQYDASTWFDLLEQEQISVWYTAPTALRMLMREDPVVYEGRDLSRLRYIFSVGEPLNPEVIHWARQVIKKDIYDTWFQTETGGIMISNGPMLEVKPGSMGKPVDGIEIAIIDDAGKQVADGVQGNLCIKSGWPSMFIAYLNNAEVYSKKFKDGYYYTGDIAYKDAEGYFWFIGRNDDVINTAGHLVSPFEVESALLEIEEVAESGVIGVPDQLLFEKVVAFIHLHRHVEWSKELDLKIKLYVSNKASSIATPREILVVDSIPKNQSGKIMRRVLKSRYMGTDIGDISTLEI